MNLVEHTVKEKFCLYVFVVVVAIVYDSKYTTAARIARKKTSIYPPSVGIENNRHSFWSMRLQGKLLFN